MAAKPEDGSVPLIIMSALPSKRRDNSPDDSGGEGFADEEMADGIRDDEDFDPEGPDPNEMDSSDDPDLDVCPYCRKLISEETERCPHCGRYISAEDAPLSPAAWITIAIVTLILVALLFQWL